MKVISVSNSKLLSFKFLSLALLLSLSLTLIFTSNATATPLNYDQVSKSTPSTVNINSDSSLSWSYKDNKGKDVNDLSSFGEAGNHLAPGFYSNERTMQAFVDSSGKWSFANGKSVSFGKDGAVYIAGGDYNGDGLSDLAYASKACKRGKSKFNTLLNPLNTEQSQINIPVGRGNTYKFFYDANADGSDDICYLKANSNKRKNKLNGRFHSICKDIASKKKIKTVNLGRVHSQPLSLRVLNGSDYILLTRQKKNKTILTLITSNGKKFAQYKYDKTGTIVLGNFTSNSIEQIAMVGSSNAIVIDPLTGSSSTISFPSGIAYDQNNIEHFEEKASCFCKTKTINKLGYCKVSKDEVNNDGDSDGNDSNGGSSFYAPNNCSNPPSHISDGDGFKCIASTTRGGTTVCLLPYQFTWTPHKSTTDHHGHTFACNSNDDHFSKATIVLNSGERIDLSYAGCHNYVGTPEGKIGRQHFRDESRTWDSIKNSVDRIEMSINGSKTCLKF